MKKIIVSVFLVSAAFAQTTGTYTVNKLKVKGDATVDGTLSVGGTVVPRPPVVSSPNSAAADIVDGGNRNPLWLSADRSVIYGGGGGSLYRSTDDGANWVLLHSFGANIQGVRELDNGELLVSLDGIGTPGKVWLSTGYPALGTQATWTNVLTAGGANNNYIQGGWGMSCYRNICVVSEYGSTVSPNNAGKVYRSLDYGATWTTILDLTAVDGVHIHGVAYDPWWDAIWVVNGDGTPSNPISGLRVAFGGSVSGALSWTVVETGTNGVNGFTQYVGIVPMQECVLFTTDGWPNGIHRIARTVARTVSAPVVAYQLNSTTDISHVGGSAFVPKGPGMPVVIPFIASSGPGTIVGTYDGWNFSTIWTDTASYTLKGPQTVVGPTIGGKLVSALYDDRQANYSMLTLLAPPVETITPPCDPTRRACIIASVTKTGLASDIYPPVDVALVPAGVYRATVTARTENAGSAGNMYLVVAHNSGQGVLTDAFALACGSSTGTTHGTVIYRLPANGALSYYTSSLSGKDATVGFDIVWERIQ